MSSAPAGTGRLEVEVTARWDIPAPPSAGAPAGRAVHADAAGARLPALPGSRKGHPGGEQRLRRRARRAAGASTTGSTSSRRGARRSCRRVTASSARWRSPTSAGRSCGSGIPRATSRSTTRIWTARASARAPGCGPATRWARSATPGTHGRPCRTFTSASIAGARGRSTRCRSSTSRPRRRRRRWRTRARWEPGAASRGPLVPLSTSPVTRAAAVVELPRTTVVRVLGATASWYRVRLPDDRTGFVPAATTRAADDPAPDRAPHSREPDSRPSDPCRGRARLLGSRPPGAGSRALQRLSPRPGRHRQDRLAGERAERRRRSVHARLTRAPAPLTLGGHRRHRTG